MKTSRTTYLVARTHGLKTHLLRSENIFQMLRSKDITETYDLLLKTDYSKELSKTPPRELDEVQLEAIFYQKLSHRLFFILSITSGKAKGAVEAYCRRIEIENLKRIVRTIHAKEKISEDQLIPIPRKYQSVNFHVLLETKNVREMVNLLKASRYKDLADALDLYEKYDNPLIIEAQANRIYYKFLWKTLDKISDENKIRDLVGTEIDLKNLTFLLSMKYMNVDFALMQKILINVHYKLLGNTFSQFGSASLQATPEFVTWPPYRGLAEKAVDLASRGMLNEAENVFSNYLFSHAETIAVRNPNSLVYVFAYLQLCFREARNLITLTLGKQLKLDAEKIRTLLFL
jgi:V/A-type H+-transporting ATPase subunit C